MSNTKALEAVDWILGHIYGANEENTGFGDCMTVIRTALVRSELAPVEGDAGEAFVTLNQFADAALAWGIHGVKVRPAIALLESTIKGLTTQYSNARKMLDDVISERDKVQDELAKTRRVMENGCIKQDGTDVIDMCPVMAELAAERTAHKQTARNLLDTTGLLITEKEQIKDAHEATKARWEKYVHIEQFGLCPPGSTIPCTKSMRCHDCRLSWARGGE